MNLERFFQENPKLALAFSGGVDSSALLYAGVRSGADIHAYYVKTPFQPDFELADAKRLVDQLGVSMTVIEKDILSEDMIRLNPQDRCYHCKRAIFSEIKKQAEADGYSLLLDGSNASDDPADRPGMKALEELKVRSPLREAGLDKAAVRSLAKEGGLFTWDKPAYACLATRIPPDQEISREMLTNIEKAEDFLFSLGFTNFRVRVEGQEARLVFPKDQLEAAFAKREELLAFIKPFFKRITLDLEGRSDEDE